MNARMDEQVVLLAGGISGIGSAISVAVQQAGNITGATVRVDAGMSLSFGVSHHG